MCNSDPQRASTQFNIRTLLRNNNNNNKKTFIHPSISFAYQIMAVQRLIDAIASTINFIFLRPLLQQIVFNVLGTWNTFIFFLNNIEKSLILAFTLSLSLSDSYWILEQKSCTKKVLLLLTFRCVASNAVSLKIEKRVLNSIESQTRCSWI